MSSVGNGPFAVRTKLGWTVNGPLRENTGKGRPMKTIVNRISVSSLENLWLQQFKVDFPEGGKYDEVEISREDHQFMDMVMEFAKLVDGHYTLCLPHKNPLVHMTNNHPLAEQGAQNLKRTFLRNDNFRQEYTDFLEDLIKKGGNVMYKEGKVWYLPHHVVYHPVKKKLRVVFDCAASYQGTSLNSQLL